MAIKTVSPNRVNTTQVTYQNAAIAALDAAVNAYIVGQMADATKTWTVRIVNSFWDGAMYNTVLEASYPEINEDQTGQVPELP